MQLVKDGDVIVVRVPGAISDDVRQATAKQVKEVFAAVGRNVEVLVLGEGADIEVIKAVGSEDGGFGNG